MKRRNKLDTDISFLFKNDIIIYPVFCKLKKVWLLEVSGGGKVLKRYSSKPIGKGSILRGKDYEVQINKLAKYWVELLIKNENNG